jgi:hypothetical protein
LEGDTNDYVTFLASGGAIRIRSLTAAHLESIWLGRKPGAAAAKI